MIAILAIVIPAIEITAIEITAIGNRVYTDKTRLRGLRKTRPLKPRLYIRSPPTRVAFLESAKADFVCVEAISIAVSISVSIPQLIAVSITQFIYII